MKCIIPCAGRGTRMGLDKPKVLLEVNGKSILKHIVDQWAGVVDGFIIIVSPKDEAQIRQNSGEARLIIQEEPRGLADAILQAEGCVNGKFIINLGDCLFRGGFQEDSLDLGIGVWKMGTLDELKKSYSVVVSNGLAREVVEKPTQGLLWKGCGMGIYFLDTRVFDYIRKAKVTPGGGDFTEVLQNMIGAGEEIKPVWFGGQYINITYPEDLEKAEEMLR